MLNNLPDGDFSVSCDLPKSGWKPANDARYGHNVFKYMIIRGDL
ncbi:hypothetical protein HMPREF1981_01036 [Bacteroides pyogenes F0041]|nr:hypothetical protein HMPREF1981_01036 [Bacteroides pyogenes F0041]